MAEPLVWQVRGTHCPHVVQGHGAVPCREGRPSSGWRAVGREAAGRRFCSSLAHDLQSPGWKEPNIQARDTLRTEGPIWERDQRS